MKLLARVVFLGVLGVSTLAATDPKPTPHKVNLALAVSRLEPVVGDAEGGTYVRVIGAGFLTDPKGDTAENTKVYFGARQGAVVRIASDTELIVQAPAGKIGEKVDVLVIWKARGEAKLASAFTFIDKAKH